MSAAMPEANDDGVVRALELGERELEPPHGRVVQTGVDRVRAGGALALGERVEETHRLVEVGDRIGAREVDRRSVDLERREVATTGVAGECFGLSCHERDVMFGY